MTIVNYYWRTANSAATLPYGPVTAGGGAGTEASPYSSFANVEALVESAAGAGDDLVLHFHPACIFSSPNTPLDVWLDVGRITGGWASVTLKRWQAIVDAEPLYADWYPTIHSHATIASGSWTEGSVSGGVWGAGTGDVFRAGPFTINANAPTRLRCWGGHQIGDNTASYTIAGRYCRTPGDLTMEGDYALVQQAGSDYYLLFKTGTTSINPTTKYGHFTWVGWVVALEADNPKNLTWEDFQVIGGEIKMESGSAGAYDIAVDNITLIRPRHRMACGGNGWTVNTNTATPSAIATNTIVIDPDFDANIAPVRMGGAFDLELGAQNGLNCQGTMDGLFIYNPKIKGYTHSNIQCQAANAAGTPSKDVYPRNCHIIVTDYSNGKSTLTGGPNNERNLNWAIPGGSTIGPLRFREGRANNQIAGTVTIRSVDQDNTNFNIPPPSGGGSGDYGGGNLFTVGTTIHSGGAGEHTFDASVQRVRFYGIKQDLTKQFAIISSFPGATDQCVVRGSLVRDDGHLRYRVLTTEANAGFTRRRTPYYLRSTSTSQPNYQTFRDNFLIFSNTAGQAVEGMVNIHKSGAGENVNDSASTSPVNQYDEAVSGEDATINYTAARIAGNQQVENVISGFGFDDNLNYTGPRLTPIQTSSRVGRGYR